MAGLILLIVLCAVMALASFFAGALPLSMTLSQSQLRLISSIGVGVLVGTSMIVIIPEGIEAATTPAEPSHAHRARSLLKRIPYSMAVEGRELLSSVSSAAIASRSVKPKSQYDSEAAIVNEAAAEANQFQSPRKRQDGSGEQQKPAESPEAPPKDDHDHDDGDEHHDEVEVPTLEIGLSMILGFILMFLIDRLPRHASESLSSAPEPQHISMDNLGGSSSATGDEEEGFLGSLTPTPRHARSMATTIGLVIHAAADGIAMGASATASSMKLGFIIFMAIMIHKAPAAFGLTSVLLKQGLSKRAARAHLIVFSLAAPVGALTTYLLVSLLGGDNAGDEAGHWWTGMLLLFSGGTFLYVAMHAMEESGSHSHDQTPAANGYMEAGAPNARKPQGPALRDTLATTVGMLLPLLTQFGHHHH